MSLGPRAVGLQNEPCVLMTKKQVLVHNLYIFSITPQLIILGERELASMQIPPYIGSVYDIPSCLNCVVCCPFTNFLSVS